MGKTVLDLYGNGEKIKIIIRILTVILLVGIYSCDFKNKNQAYAEILIEKVEIFKKEHNRLPKNVNELGLSEFMDSPAFYQLESDTTYMIWYGLNLGTSKIYRSQTKKWTKEG